MAFQKVSFVLTHPVPPGLAPEYMQLMFTKLSENISRSLCNTNTDLRIPLFATSYGQRSFSNRGVTVWNKLSTEYKMPLNWLY